LLDWNVLHAEEGYNPRLIALADRMQTGIDDVVRERLKIGATNFSISLSDIGWRIKDPSAHTGDIELFGKFLKTCPDLPAYKQFFGRTGTCRNLYHTNITEDVMEALKTSLDNRI